MVLLLSICITTNTQAYISSYYTSFNDGTLGQNYNIGWLKTTAKDNSAYFGIDDTNPYGFGRCIRAEGTALGEAEGWFNLTTIGDVTYFRVSTNETDDDIATSIYFYDSSQGLDGQADIALNCIIRIELTSTDKFQYVDYNNVDQVLVNDRTPEEYNTWGFTINSVDDVTYYYNGSTFSGTPKNISALVEGYSIDSIFWYTDGIGAGDTLDIDNVYIKTDEISGSTNEVNCGEFPQKEYIGRIPSMTDIVFNQVLNPTIEYTYASPVTGTFYHLDIFVGLGQYTINSNLSKYHAYINGYSIGNADCMFRYQDGYILRFSFAEGRSIDNQTLTIEIHNDEGINCYDTEICNECELFGFTWDCNCQTVEKCTYWSLAVTRDSNNDLDNDGDVEYRDNGDNFNVGHYDGTLHNHDIAYKLYHNGLVTYDDNPQHDDQLMISGYNSVQEDGTPMFYEKTNTVFLSYFLSDLTTATYLRIWNTDTSTEVGLTQGFGLGNKLNYYDHTLGFVPYDTGNYKASLYRGGVNITNKSFYVSSIVDTDRVLFTVPNPSNQYNEFGVFYNYTHIDGWKGAIGMSYDSSALNKKTDCEYFIDGIPSGTGGVFSYVPNEIRTHYWRLFVSINNGTSFLPYGGIHAHYIYDNTIYENTINANPTVIELAENPDNQKVIHLTGTHSHLGADIQIKINGNIFTSVSNDQSFTKFYYPSKAGMKKATLEINNNGTWTVLATTYFNVSEAGETSSSDGIGIFPKLDILMGAIVGLVLVCFLTLAPLIFLKGLKSRHAVPPIVYVLMSLIGIVIATIFGWFPNWVIMFIVIMSIIMLAIQYVLKSGGNASGD